MGIMGNNCTYQLTPDLRICRIINGMWQVAGAHGYIDRRIGYRRYDKISMTQYYCYTAYNIQLVLDSYLTTYLR